MNCYTYTSINTSFIKTILILFSFIILIVSCTHEKISPQQLAEQMKAHYEGKTSLSYDIDYRIKYFSSIDDTTKVSATIDLISDPVDSILGGYVWIKSDSMERYYDTKHTYFIDHRNQLITRYPQDKPFVITGNSVSETIRMYFLKPERLINGTTDSTITKTLTEEMLNGNPVWRLKYDFADDEYTKNTWKTIWINKDNYQIPQMQYSAEMQGENQYNQWQLDNIVYNKVTIEDLKNRFEEIANSYEIKDYEEIPQKERTLLADSSVLPNVEGTTYPDQEVMKLSDFRGKLMLLDFWYMDCFPCIKSIAHLNEIHKKYGDKGVVVIGANPFNNDEKDLKRMPNFLEHNPINYPILFIDRSEVEAFKVFAYPSFYLVDQQGKIIQSQIGFSEESVVNLDSLIEVHL